jgi:hypothetical protein
VETVIISHVTLVTLFFFLYFLSYDSILLFCFNFGNFGLIQWPGAHLAAVAAAYVYVHWGGLGCANRFQVYLLEDGPYNTRVHFQKPIKPRNLLTPHLRTFHHYSASLTHAKIVVASLKVKRVWQCTHDSLTWV